MAIVECEVEQAKRREDRKPGLSPEEEEFRRRQADIDLEIAQAAHLFDRLDSDIFDNPDNNMIGI